MTYFVIIRGPAGIGKSTIAKILSERINGCHISFDEIMREHKLDVIEGDCIKEHNFIKANEIVIPEILKNMGKGKVTVLDGNFYHKSQIEHLIKNIQYPYFVFTLKTDIGDCISRDAEREEKGRIGTQGIKDVYKLVSRFDYGIIINAGGKTAEEIVHEILSHLPK